MTRKEEGNYLPITEFDIFDVKQNFQLFQLPEEF